MDIIKVKEVLEAYKIILGDDCVVPISKEEHEILGMITGESNILNQLGFLLNVVKSLEKNMAAKIDLDNLVYYDIMAENDLLNKKVASLESLISGEN